MNLEDSDSILYKIIIAGKAMTQDMGFHDSMVQRGNPRLEGFPIRRNLPALRAVTGNQQPLPEPIRYQAEGPLITING
ncbi:hypothetical protein [Paenibacillus sp. 32O-W]|uniref:hypothetical protein n=1 Tax=Paenibacillus sp. 32O-W TaxID=1695218 RepID=UPI001C92E1E6|nr:hypothetical protein [Paenibacillus sp. 32O-W]